MQLRNISLFIISFLVILSIYQVYQYRQESDQAKDTRITLLLKEIEWKDQVISDLNDQLDNKGHPVIEESNSSLSLSQLNNPEKKLKIDDGDDPTINRDQSIQGLAQVSEISGQLAELTEALEEKNTILKNINRLTPFSKINLTEDNRDGYFDRMIEITEGSLYKSEYLLDVDKYGKVAFDKSESTPLDDTNIFDAENSRLYAHFELPDYPYEQVLVKWYREGGTEPIELNYFEINQFGNENYAWVEPNSNWQTGRYFVEIFSASESPELLSAGSYVVEN
jgi:hypothetical protein